MAAADTAKLIASLELRDKFSKPLAGASRALNGFDARLSKTEGRAFKAGQQIGTGIKNGAKIAAVGIGLIATQVLVGLKQLATLERVTVATNTVLTSTKGIAGKTAEGIRALSERLENLNATIDDKVIQSGANLLLTFTNIRKDAFEPALLAALNLNEAMGGGEEGLQKTIIQVGKALNDPAKGFTALRRVGVSFTADQIKLIKTLQAEGDLLGAQRVILQELGTEFGGRFRAQGATAEGTIAGIGDAVEDLQKGLATALFPTIQKLLPRFRELLGSPQFTTAVATLGDKINDLFSDNNIAEGGRILESVFKAAKDAAPALQAAAEMTGKVIGTAVEIFKSLPPEIQALAVAGLAINKLTGGLVTNVAGGLISAVLKQLVSGVVNVTGATVVVTGAAAIPGAGVPVAGVPGAKPSLLNTATKVVGAVTVAGLAAEFSDEISGFGVDLRKDLVGENFPKLSLSDLEWPFGPKNTPTLFPELGGNGLLGGRPVDTTKTPEAIKAAAKSDTRASLQVEQAVVRNAQRVAAASAAAARSMVGAVKEKDLSVKVNVPISSKTYINGRLLQAGMVQYSSVYNVGGRGPR